MGDLISTEDLILNGNIYQAQDRFTQSGVSGDHRLQEAATRPMPYVRYNSSTLRHEAFVMNFDTHDHYHYIICTR